MIEDKDVMRLMNRENPFNPDKAINIYKYGSRVYGTHSKESDCDFLGVTDMEEPHIQFHWGYLNVTMFSVEEFLKRLGEHEISILECVYLPDELTIKRTRKFIDEFELDNYALRRAVSAKASNSFVKAKKKMTVEADRDIYVAKKSLFHALRIPMFGEQIARHGRIVDYSVANHYWPAIRDNANEDWSSYKKKYQPIFNNIMSSFRKVAPKG